MILVILRFQKQKIWENGIRKNGYFIKEIIFEFLSVYKNNLIELPIASGGHLDFIHILFQTIS